MPFTSDSSSRYYRKCPRGRGREKGEGETTRTVLFFQTRSGSRLSPRSSFSDEENLFANHQALPIALFRISFSALRAN